MDIRQTGKRTDQQKWNKTKRPIGTIASYKVLRSYKDCLSRQAREGIFISHINGEILNNKSEFHQPAIVTIRREINRGLWLKIIGVKTIQFFPKIIPFYFHNNLVESTLFKEVFQKYSFSCRIDKVQGTKHVFLNIL